MHFLLADEQPEGKELETSGSLDDGPQEVGGENLRAKPAKSDSTKEAVIRPRGPASSGVVLESLTASVWEPVGPAGAL